MLAVALAFAVIVISYLMLSRELGYSDLAGDPAYALRMPGSEDLGSGGGDTNNFLGRNDFAFATRTFGVEVAPQEVFAYYDRELARLGWQSYPSRVSSSLHLQDRWYCRSGAVIDLATIDQTRSSLPAHKTIFDVALLATPPGEACPPRSSPLPTIP